MSKLLLFSASGYKDSAYLSHTREFIDDFLKENSMVDEEILFIPYAGVRRTYDAYEARVKEGLKKDNIKSLHHFENLKEAILNAKVFLVGGGNSFMLLHKLYENDLLEVLKERIEKGACYIGWSAGSNIAGLSIKTTNDMPIVMPKSFDSLGVFPYQINPHFISGKIPGHNGESREERLEEFLLTNPKDIVYAIPEGSALKIQDDNLKIIGHHDVLKLSYPFNLEYLKVNQTTKI
ncbi:dipeptidase PepE [Campylobacter lari]|uniref:dipeptidase PepE n=1 Tax=Campylobacter lari TaxID=201 RepID=UPI0021525D92|nr:dipeptidase PepE [Campylobacter lari]MCR6512166.1 dipeptidase PepE [Campylobacter lari]MCV3410822.1 dipeptidase PepE [Campylobacter lari]MCV3419720.1 dipeptidase PepE [Campylobacter lari]MCV3447003.1 dipeptidase PepE [Campylobacter lari]MCV3450921.1 dipeptidase PepE [Campylobacter lari]